MRLINLADLQNLTLKEFVGRPEPYAILSHRWGDGEVSYQDFLDVQRRTQLAGNAKIMMLARQAQKDGLKYAWMDTCCIDKTSSAELGEAINSMFKWYQRARVCYAYLEDVDVRSNLESVSVDFSSSQWFKRGWTLQELIAPSNVRFFSKEWVEIGNKAEMVDLLHSATRIDKDVLRGGQLNRVSVARRMSWAASRQTTREEDIAYCLLGIFELNMPTIYGEGSKAFMRLQEEIIKEYDDHSLLAWQAISESFPSGTLFRGVLATSPAEFGQSYDIEPFRDLDGTNPLTITSKGLQITSIVGPSSSQNLLIGLNCRQQHGNIRGVVAIELTNDGGNQYIRVRPSKLFNLLPSRSIHEMTLYIVKHSARNILNLPPHLNWRYGISIGALPQNIYISSVYPPTVNYDRELGILEMQPRTGERGVAVLALRSGMSPYGGLITFEVAFDEHTHKYSCSFLTEDFIEGIQASEEESARSSLHKLNDKDSNRVPPLKSLTKPIWVGRTEFSVSVEFGKVQGIEMFLVHVL